MPGARRKDFVDWCREKARGEVVTLWRGKGHHRWTPEGLKPSQEGEAYDCSGLVTCALWAANGQDMRATHNAQKLYDATQPIPLDEATKAGDLHFYGSAADGVTHVVVDNGDGRIISASGATKSVQDFKTAKAVGAKVRVHDVPKYRVDYLCAHRNHWLEG